MDKREGGNDISRKCAPMFKYYTIRNTRNGKVVVVVIVVAVVAVVIVVVVVVLLLIIITIIIQQFGS